MGEEIIRLKDVWVSYGSFSDSALRDINFSVKKHDFVGIIGPNGGGKSTLLKVILGLLKPDRGEVSIMGQSAEKGRRLLGYVPQHTNFDPAFPVTVKEVTFMGRLNKRGLFRQYNKEDSKIVARALERVELTDLKDRKMSDLSGGERQRVYIARALATEPPVLILDEPTASVDSKIASKIYELLKELNEEITIILVSHDIGSISSYVKTIGCLNQRLIYHETKELTPSMVMETYHCPVDLIAHGVPHRVLAHHPEQEK